MPTVATGDVHAHHARRARLQDALVAIRNRTSLDGCERERRGNHESVLLTPQEMAERFPDDADAVARTLEIADRLQFDLTEELGYRYPDFSDGAEPAGVQLRRVCERAFTERYNNLNGHKRRVHRRLEEELTLIDELGLAGFFLLHWEVLELAREVAQPGVAAAVAALVGSLQLDVEAVPPEGERQPCRGVRVADGEPVARTAREADESLVQILEQRQVEPRRQWLAVRRVARVCVRCGLPAGRGRPGRPRLQPRHAPRRRRDRLRESLPSPHGGARAHA